MLPPSGLTSASSEKNLAAEPARISLLAGLARRMSLSTKMKSDDHPVVRKCMKGWLGQGQREGCFRRLRPG